MTSLAQTRPKLSKIAWHEKDRLVWYLTFAKGKVHFVIKYWWITKFLYLLGSYGNQQFHQYNLWGVFYSSQVFYQGRQ